MSYRTFKHLLGETSLERKCRFIFGAGILALVTLSFYWYGQKTERLVIIQNREAGRALVDPVIKSHHVEALFPLETDPIALETAPNFDYRLLAPDVGEEAIAPGSWERQWINLFVRAADSGDGEPAASGDLKPLEFPDGTPMEAWRVTPDRDRFQYMQAVTFPSQCMGACHGYGGREMIPPEHTFARNDSGFWDERQVGDLACIVLIDLPMERTTKAIHQNRAILISAALVTAILAMVASFVIVRYIIVKPVKHLRDVSNAIAAGKLSIRSQIHTGDEFEELSHAFNRMLHSLVTMQQQLRNVNDDLDRKVDELAQANLALFEMNRLKSDFLATMSHELRTPLNSIIGFSEVLATSDKLTEKQRRYASNIQKSGKMLLSMINDILDLAKIESGRIDVRVEDFSVRDLCEALIGTMRPQAEVKSIDLRCSIDEEVPLLRQDAGKLKQIIYNLVSNAIKFTPEGGRVELNAATSRGMLVLRVTDTGIGIAEEDRARIFEKFRQVQPPGTEGDVLTREHQGTGLGLSIVRELTQLLGGQIALESEPGIGSTFTVTLPLQLEEGRSIAVSEQGVDLSRARLVTTDFRRESTPPEPHLPNGSTPARNQDDHVSTTRRAWSKTEAG